NFESEILNWSSLRLCGPLRLCVKLFPPLCGPGNLIVKSIESDLRARTDEILAEEDRIRLGGGPEAIERQHAKGRMTARERVGALLDLGSPTLELGLWAAYQLYEEWGGAPGAGVVTAIGSVHGRRVMVVANDATVKAGACFPMTIKKI